MIFTEERKFAVLNEIRDDSSRSWLLRFELGVLGVYGFACICGNEITYTWYEYRRMDIYDTSWVYCCCQGLWVGAQIGIGLQTIVLIIMCWRADWEKEVQLSKDGVPEDVGLGEKQRLIH
ncbi:hypothetical protein MKW98_005102 [Papaver atlanticum]|uniref:Uncharacterized protein n=1 Tax=Papaver atlanticum TaxID=357466 RepID=A0AAD4RWI1_9MAGN|nr:hypothetical protein MKW98_005102 [Papaver atlanticum]